MTGLAGLWVPRDSTAGKALLRRLWPAIAAILVDLGTDDPHHRQLARRECTADRALAPVQTALMAENITMVGIPLARIVQRCCHDDHTFTRRRSLGKTQVRVFTAI